MKKISIILLPVLIVIVYASLFRLPESHQAIVLRFGKIVTEPITKAGLHFKMPFIDNVRYFDKRILIWDGDSEEIPTKDKKLIWVDSTARWKIKDPIAFLKNVVNEFGAQNKLNGVIDSITRDIISRHNLVEAIRNTNNIINVKKEKMEQRRQNESEDVDVVEDDFIGEVEEVNVGREKLSEMITEKSRKSLTGYGIELIDVQLRGIAYKESVQKKVFDRMISERKRIAEKIRSIGKGEEAVIRGRISKDLKEIESTAYRKAKEIKGQAEAEATRIYAQELGKDPDFYNFVKSMETYRKTLKKSKFYLTTDSEFLKIFKKGP